MAKFNKILVPLDGSANSMRGLDRAIEIAKGGNAEITGFYVFHLPLAAGIKYTAKMKDEAQKKAVKAIGPAMNKTQKAGATFKYKTGGGHTGSEIVKAAEKGKFDMIVIGARGVGGAKETFLGSTSNYVMHKTKLPVLIVK
ncbi:universal stress protein [Nitrosopumilus adriaticus]|uniref:Universal stress family protein n=1 Tax=Nitrosopumilus adriaticus TaxID=1580092 RepID=A0A0D5BZ45_9ARCH|nr:universal stress protein [Nitrosopumilus adriaticus]AJW69799.1 Universal stress family protein [Nitrosopumilus adriaticus]MBT8173188.1 universal stress protein [Nitrosopumilus sp.]